MYHLDSVLGREEAYRLACLHVERKAAAQELGAARQQREERLGRRPSVARIAQLQKRANLADKAFMAAWAKFETKYGNGHHVDLAKQIQRDPDAGAQTGS